jgi:hypothetical protein
MGAWVKLFVDGSKEHGSDQEIAKGNASWSRGRLDGIREVRLFGKTQVCSLSVPNTLWHQFDRFIVVVSEGTPQPIKTHQVAQAEIKDIHVGLSLVGSNNGGCYFWTMVQDIRQSNKNSFLCKLIEEEDVGKWLTVVLPSRDYPRITFSTKGKINDNKYISR